MWRNGRTECYASVPGVPSLADQERRDGLPGGILQELVDTGVLAVAHGQRVADIDVLLDRLPDVAYEAVVADRFALMTLADAVAARGLPDPEFLTNQWSTASEAIAAFRTGRVRWSDDAGDGPVAGDALCEPCRASNRTRAATCACGSNIGATETTWRKAWSWRR